MIQGGQAQGGGYAGQGPAPAYPYAYPPPPGSQQAPAPYPTQPSIYMHTLPPPYVPQQPPPGPPQPIMVFVNVNTTAPPPGFDLVSKIHGEGGSNLGYVAGQTGTSVQLRGRGHPGGPASGSDGPEPLHVLISGPTVKGIEEARG